MKYSNDSFESLFAEHTGAGEEAFGVPPSGGIRAEPPEGGTPNTNIPEIPRKLGMTMFVIPRSEATGNLKLPSRRHSVDEIVYQGTNP